jgi:hypothetical protein
LDCADGSNPIQILLFWVVVVVVLVVRWAYFLDRRSVQDEFEQGKQVLLSTTVKSSCLQIKTKSEAEAKAHANKLFGSGCTTAFDSEDRSSPS